MRTRLNKRLLGVCIFFSFFLHALCILTLQQHSIWFAAHTNLAANKPALSKGQILQETFQVLSKSIPQTKPSPQTIRAIESLTSSSPKPVSRNESLRNQHPSSMRMNALVAENDVKPALHSQSFESLTFDLKGFAFAASPSPLPKSKITPPKKHPEMPVAFAKFTPPKVESFRSHAISYEKPPFNIAALKDPATPRRPLLTIPTPPMPNFPTLDELETSSYSEAFDVDLVCLPKQDQTGYIFALTLIPQPDLKLPKMHQHYTFLIDRSNSIQRERLLATKSAVLKALEYLSPDDTFNIFVFDSKVEKLFASKRSPDTASLSQTKTLLDKINLGSFFAPADLYNPLLMTLPQQIQDDEIYTTILLTDGENLIKKSAMRTILQGWTGQNNGSVALFTVAKESDHALPLLDVASAFNKGRLYDSPTNRGIRRKLLKLMKNIQMPVAKTMACRAIGKSQKGKIDLFPSFANMPHLYLEQPFVIIGSCDNMDDFILFVQGRMKDRWLNIKKTISFINAKKGSSSLKQQWAVMQAYQCYERYVNDDNPEHLVKARELLQPFDVQFAFQ